MPNVLMGMVRDQGRITTLQLYGSSECVVGQGAQMIHFVPGCLVEHPTDLFLLGACVVERKPDHRIGAKHG